NYTITGDFSPATNTYVYIMEGDAARWGGSPFSEGTINIKDSAQGSISLNFSLTVVYLNSADNNNPWLSGTIGGGGGTFLLGGSLFTTGDDTVNFNSLLPAQQTAIAAASDRALLYSGLGGSDTVTLPNKANYNESVGNGQTLGWTDSAAS